MELTGVRMLLPAILLWVAFPLRVVAEVPSAHINPALLYWQAFASMEELSTAETTTLSRFINQPATFDSTKAKALLDKRERALSRFRKAAESGADCDWGLTYEEGPHLPLPHLSKMQTLSRLALLKAETLFANHQANEAMDWLLAVHRAARHCGAGDLIIPVLSQFQIEQSVIKATAAHVLAWDETLRLEYLSRWKALPPLHSLKNAINGELQFVGWLENFWLQGMDLKIPSGIETDEIAVDAADAKERAEAEKMVAQFTTENIRKWAHEMRDLYLQIQSTLDKSWSESNPALLALQSEYKNSDNPIMVLSAPMPLHKVNDLGFETATLATMLEAALEQGPLLDADKMSAYKDAYLGAPLMLGYPADKNLLLTISPETVKKIGGKIGRNSLLLPLPKQK